MFNLPEKRSRTSPIDPLIKSVNIELEYLEYLLKILSFFCDADWFSAIFVATLTVREYVVMCVIVYR